MKGKIKFPVKGKPMVCVVELFNNDLLCKSYHGVSPFVALALSQIRLRISFVIVECVKTKQDASSSRRRSIFEKERT